MLSQAQRTTILELATQGVGKREIARVLGISRVAVRKVLRANSAAVPELQLAYSGTERVSLLARPEARFEVARAFGETG